MKIPLGFEARVLAAFTAAVLLVAGVAALTWKVSSNAVESALEVARTREVLDTISEVDAHLRQAISAVRGHTITGDATYLDDVGQAAQVLKTSLRRLQELTSDNPVQQQNWQRLRALVDGRLALIERTAQLRKTEGFEAARSFVASGLARDASRRFSSLLEAMEAEEQRLLALRGREQARASDLAVASGAVGALLLVALLTGTYWLIRRHFSERKQAEAALQQVASIVKSSNDAIVSYTTDGRVTSWNPGAQRLFGYREDEVLGKSHDFLLPAGLEAESERIMATLERAEAHSDLETKRLAKDGRHVDVSFAASRIVDPTGKHIGNSAIYHDIGERLRARAEIERKNQELEQASRAKSDFLANMSHELRTPMNSIIGFSEMLKDGMLGDLNAKQRGFVTDIFDAGTHLLSLINDILDLSKVEAGMLKLEADSLDLPALLRASLLVVREKAMNQRIRLRTELDPALGSMLADERKVKQIIYNLLSNAVKFTPEGGSVTLRARRCTRAEVALDQSMPGRLRALPSSEDREFLAISVEDSGVGIAEADLHKLFEPFTQVDSSLARRQAGTGLGLSLVLRLAMLHGGTAGVASREGFGSRFSVWLPYRTALPLKELERPAPLAAPALEVLNSKGAPLALVIEDDDQMADQVAAQLRSEGFEVMRAATGEEGLVRAAKRRPQLITLDIFLPAMDGWEFLHRLRANPALADTPVVIISIAGDLQHGLALGARRVLQKPFARNELVAALAGLVGTRPDGEQALVLVVDDNVQAVQVLAQALEAEGYRVLRAYGGAEAIRAARSETPDLVMLDLMMPDVSGFEVARALRTSERTAHIPILVLTAKDLSAQDHARLNGDVSTVMAKASLTHEELLTELRRALPRFRSH